jgi:hypothetical protein
MGRDRQGTAGERPRPTLRLIGSGAATRSCVGTRVIESREAADRCAPGLSVPALAMAGVIESREAADRCAPGLSVPALAMAGVIESREAADRCAPGLSVPALAMAGVIESREAADRRAPALRMPTVATGEGHRVPQDGRSIRDRSEPAGHGMPEA